MEVAEAALVDIIEVDVTELDVELDVLVWRIRIPGLEISKELAL